MFDPRQLRVLDSEQVMEERRPGADRIATQIGLLQSRNFIAEVMDRLAPVRRPRVQRELLAEPRDALARPARQPLDQLLSCASGRGCRHGLASQAQPVLESDAPGLVRERAILNFTDKVTYPSDGVVVPDLDQFQIARSRQGSDNRQRIAHCLSRIRSTDKIMLAATRPPAGSTSGWPSCGRRCSRRTAPSASSRRSTTS